MRARNNRGGRGVAFLLMHLLSIGIEHIPPITLGVIAICTALYLGVIPPLDFSLSHVCLGLRGFLPSDSGAPTSSPYSDAVSSVLGRVFRGARQGMQGRKFLFHPAWTLIASSFYHVDDMHLYYNMCSWLVKARSIELNAGPEFLVLLVLVSVILTNATYLVLCVVSLLGTGILFDADSLIAEWMAPWGCAVGLSGVIFFLKTYLTMNEGEFPPVEGGLGLGFFSHFFRGERKMAIWLELLLIQLLVPNVSFVGHLAGILAALVFVKLRLGVRVRAVAEDLKQIRVRYG